MSFNIIPEMVFVDYMLFRLTSLLRLYGFAFRMNDTMSARLEFQKKQVND